MNYQKLNNGGFDPDIDRSIVFLCDHYNSLSDEEKKRLIQELTGPANRAIDPTKIKWFIERVGRIKNFMTKHTPEFRLDININETKRAVVEIVLSQLNMDDVKELRKVCDGCVFFEIIITDDGYLKLNISYDIIVSVGGNLL